MLGRRRRLEIELGGGLALAAAALLVQARALTLPLFSDDYFWLALPARRGWAWRVLVPGSFPDVIYRPLLAYQFWLLHALFGRSALAYHVVALGALAGCGVLLRLVAGRVGLSRKAAWAAALIYVAHAALTSTVAWASATGSLTAAAFALGAIYVTATPQPFGVKHRAGAALLFVCALLAREVSVAIPPIVTFLLLAAVPDGTQGRLRRAIDRSSALWVLLAVHLVGRLLSGSVPNDGPYAVKIGPHVFTNTATLLRHAAGIRAHAPTASVLVGFAVVVSALCGLARQRRDAVIPAGLVWFLLALGPTVVLPNHAMEPYYLDLALGGLAIAVARAGQLLTLSRRRGVPVALAAAFVVANGLMAREFITNDLRVAVRRTAQLRLAVPRDAPSSGRLVVQTSCLIDEPLTRDGDFYRVLLDSPDLQVRFLVTGEQCSLDSAVTTSAG